MRNNALFVVAMALSCAGTTAVQSQDGGSLFGVDSASVTYGPYVRGAAGYASDDLGEGKWLPPGQADPAIFFDTDGEAVAFAEVGLGFDWQNGIRADLSAFATATRNVNAPCARASDGSSCTIHADISQAPVKSQGLMLNLFYAPFEAGGSNAPFQPFLVAGLGPSWNAVDDWTRVNPNFGRPVRIFEGDTSLDLAWSLGVGASYQITKPGEQPILIEAQWRYYDFGEASGSPRPLAGFGGGEPRDPFSFDHRSHVVTIGVRIPLQRY